MSDPPRLLDGGASELERSLLKSWESERPSPEGRERALAIAAMGTIALTAAAKGASLAPKAALGASSFGKWLLLGAFVAAAGGTAAYVHHRMARSSDAVASKTAAVVPAAPLVPSPQVAAAPVAPSQPAPSVAQSAPAISEPAPRAAAAHSPSAGPRPASTLGDQVTALDRARRALADGDSRGALHALDDYEARYPHGVLAEEAEVVRVEALVAAGDHEGAARVGARFLASHPNSPHASRVRALLGDP
jgi:hypothetical protein